MSVVGPLGDGLFRKVNVQKAFMGAAGFSLASGLSDATPEEAEIKRLMVAHAREVIAIVDHSKWQRAAFATFGRVDDLTGVIGDGAAPEAMVRTLRERGIDVRLSDVDGGPATDGRAHQRAPPRGGERDDASYTRPPVP